MPPHAPASQDLHPAHVALAEGALAGDGRAWHELVAHFDPILRSVIRRYRLGPAEVDDVVQCVWLRVYLRLGSLRDPACLGAWLVMVARREALRALQRGVTEVLTDEPPAREDPASGSAADTLIEDERRVALHSAVRRLPSRQRTVVTALLRNPDSSYEELSDALAIPVGSIGPTRQRALRRLRRDAMLTSALG